MIIGKVNADYEPIIPIAICDRQGKLHERDAVIDTGFDGWLCLPPDLIAELQLNWKRRGRALLADGSESIFDIYEATVVWDGQFLTIPIDEAECDPLVGMLLMKGYELKIQVINGGIVKLMKLPIQS
ncbi:putative aspartyl protease [Rivularia sp. PCC 7116]|uniref:aspartyl protease n=1 Tax=Rivularia sp. PCC 7116 TaxID=373994 RepID=UPI00029F1724|nr:aspartyl protease [Rivularia sp. PCC 7116]AFY55480.1 putative aspartyl protease [Rivularia sp. PCC 7116]